MFKNTSLVTSAQATLHCLLGCVIGEVAGLLIGVSLGLGVLYTIVLAVGLAYISGFCLAILPIMSRESLGLLAAIKVVWLGEAISIGAMEIAMNGIDFWIGGIQSDTLMTPIFWIGLAVAIPCGYFAAWPVNHFLLSRQLKACH